MIRGLDARFRVSVSAAMVLVGVGCSSSTPGDQDGNVIGVGTPPAGSAGAGGSAMVGPGGAPINGGMAGTGGSSVGAASAMPCEIETVVNNRCGTCHGATPIGGSPMSLLTLADFQKDYTARTTQQLIGRSFKMYELARIRINREMGTTGMPQGTPLEEAEKSMLTTWLTSGAPAGTACAPSTGGMAGSGTTGMAGNGSTGMAGAGGSGAPRPMGTINECEDSTEAFEPLVARDGETCYEFLTHGASSPTDTSKFSVPPGESYNQFYYDVPWPAGTVATRFGADFDNLTVLHHWLGFASRASTPAGTVSRDVTGTTLGENAELVGGWAVGGCNVEFPADMGLKLPDTGRIMIQWHHFNSTGTPQMDGSIVQWCTVPASMRPNIGGLTFLGTENFNGPIGMPPGMGEFGGTCTNDSGGPVTIVGFNPHMHLLGVHMKSVIDRAAGGTETVFDEPFQFDQQVNYIMNPPVVVQPGDRITSTCTFNNTTDANVAFGQPTTSEMCYQFAFAYPYGALNNGVFSLIGATNTCW
jgi:hypothetical protein